MSSILLFITLSAAFLVVSFSTVRHTGSDPRATLLTTESILARQTIKLDHYGKEVLESYGYVIHKKNGHYYHRFPIGTAISSIPFVALARGWNLNIRQSEPALQIMIAAIVAVLILVVLTATARLFLPPIPAVLISGVFWFGTSLASTAGTALWSHDFAVLFSLISIYLLLRSARDGKEHLWPLISAFLFFAYLCRPTMAVLAPFALLFLFSYNRAVAIKTGILLALFIGCFAGWSLYEFDQLLPDYYQPDRLHNNDISTALYGNLLSPARGLLVYSPFILVTWICIGASTKAWGLNRFWLLIGLAWPLAHLLVISRFPNWWGGFSFGARFMTDVLPGLFLLTLYAWPTAVDRFRDKAAVAVLGTAVLFSVYVNTCQGLFNEYTAKWNEEPNIARNPQYLFDWRYPQFLHNEARHEERLIRDVEYEAVSITPNSTLRHDTNNLAFVGWSSAEENHRWSLGNSAWIVFSIETAVSRFQGELKIRVRTLGNQRVGISLNDTNIFNGKVEGDNEIVKVRFSPLLLVPGENTLKFSLPDAHRPGNNDKRVLALALKTLTVR